MCREISDDSAVCQQSRVGDDEPITADVVEIIVAAAGRAADLFYMGWSGDFTPFLWILN